MKVIDDETLIKLLQVYDSSRSIKLSDVENHSNGIKAIYSYLYEERIIQQIKEPFIRNICLKNLDLAYGIKEEKEKTTGSR